MPVFSNKRQKGDESGLKGRWGETGRSGGKGKHCMGKKSIFHKRKRKNQTFHHYEATFPPLSLLLLSSN